MNKKKYESIPIKPSEITPEALYHSRRNFIKRSAGIGAVALLAACGVESETLTPETEKTATGVPIAEKATKSPTETAAVHEFDGEVTDFEAITEYNNFYEFTTDKGLVSRLAEDFRMSPWEVEVGGLVNNPKVYDLEELMKKFSVEDRIYRMRCVEGWSMVIPWTGFSLSKLLDEVEPTGSARFVRFETSFDPDQMPGQKRGLYPWPYREGLRLDEAMHSLTILSTGLYGKDLLPQNGGPIRLVVPWKYGFKSIKSIVKIELVEDMPATMWSAIAPNEYGFYSNVNPEVSHPRWSQATERLIGENDRRPTLMFNGYADEVASLYDGMDLKANY